MLASMIIAVVAGLAIAVFTAVLAMRAAAAEASRGARRLVEQARGEAAAAVKAAELEGAAVRKAAEAAAREESYAARMAADGELAKSEAAVLARAEAAMAREAELAAREETIAQQAEQLDQLQREIQSRRDRAGGIDRDAQAKLKTRRTDLEARAGVSAQELMSRLGKAWLDDARARAAAMVRAVDQTAADPAHEREAKRVLEIAATRYHHHYLTERAMNNLRVGKDMVALLLDNGSAMHAALERVSGLSLLVNDDKDAVRLDGLDGVGKEMVRRALGRLVK